MGSGERIMPGVDFNLLRAEISVNDVLKQLGFQPTSRSGDQLHGPCPVHGSMSPGSRTFSVNLATGRYYCHKCHSRGNQLELWAAVHKLSMYEAAVDLCRALAREVPRIHRW
jgi:DNA primase